MSLRLIIGALVAVSLSGCATAQKPTAVNQLQIRMAGVESQLEEQEQVIKDLKYAVEGIATDPAKRTVSTKPVSSSLKTVSVASPETPTADTQKILRVPVTPQEVQTALKNAGHYDGAIDGKLGSGSQKAIKAFQTDHGLQSDGIVGSKTWAELKNYLE